MMQIKRITPAFQNFGLEKIKDWLNIVLSPNPPN
jgi:hypothetical protein